MKYQAAAEIPLMNAEIAEMQRKIGIEYGPK
jgi:hypothetical protein